MKRTTLLAALVLLAVALPAEAAPSLKKSIWGPVRVDGVSQFPIYEDLGAGIYQMRLSWADVAHSRPANPRDPTDPVYTWPAEVDDAIAEGEKHGIRVMLTITGAPRWANGGRKWNWAPRRPGDFADFAEAASKRYPGVRYWLVWGEPSRRANFRPIKRVGLGQRITRAQRKAPRLYARILDAAYGRLKAVNRQDLIVGGNTFTTGEVPPMIWVKLLRLPSGRPPRMDLYGHNPFTLRRPVLSQPASNHGWVDFGSLDTFARAIDRNLGHKRLFLSEWTLPTDHENHEFNFWVTRKVQARWLSIALGVTRRWRRIYSLGWLSLYDETPNRRGDQVNRGLLDYKGNKKPSYRAFKRG
jgi:hypothetical protein